MLGQVMQSKQKKIASFDPSDIGVDNGNLFGLPFTTEEWEVVVIPVPWEVTVSYRGGTARGPATMLNASLQVDLYDPEIPDAWKMGIGMQPISKEWAAKNKILRKKAESCIDNLEKGGSIDDAKVKKLYAEINEGGAELNRWMKKESAKLLKQGKSVAVLGGEHSVPLGFMHALADIYPKFSILHIDAHADMRQAYEGFEFSHASIQYNASKIKNVENQVLVGIRDYSQQEADRIKNSKGKIVAFTDLAMKRKAYEGVTWKKISEEIIKPLGKNVYISFDIDALDPSLCPHTGTPVPGGLEFEQVFYMIETLVKSGRKIIGFDLCEVAPGEKDDWDSIVGVRALYRLANLTHRSRGAGRQKS
jgi:agmatinase